MKAQSFFGGTKPKEPGEEVRQVGHTGNVQSKTGHITPKVTIRQAKSNPAPVSFSRKTRAKQVGITGGR